MLIFFPKQIIAQSTAINDVLGLLGYVRFVWLQVELVAATAEFIRGMIFQADAAELCRT